MNTMRSNPERIHAVATALATVGDDFGRFVHDLAREATAVMDSDWIGDASDSHRVLWDEWVESARGIVSALLSEARLLHRAAASYTDSDQDYQHGAVEKYSKNGRHQGEYDPNTAAQTKPADPMRRPEGS